MQNEITKFRFEGDDLDVMRDERGVWVSTRRVCDALGLDPSGQRQKLAHKAWAVAEMVSATAADGKRYEMHCLHLDSIPMWLATIDERRVAEHVRPKLAKYQLECTRVLRDHFFGPSTSPADLHALTSAVTQIASALPVMAGAIEALAQRVADLEARGPMGGTITRSQHSQLQSDVKALATLETAAGFRPSIPSALASIYNDLRAATGWGGPGQSFRQLPAHLYTHQATKALARRRADVERVLVAQAKGRQLSLLPEPTREAPPSILRGPVRAGDLPPGFVPGAIRKKPN